MPSSRFAYQSSGLRSTAALVARSHQLVAVQTVGDRSGEHVGLVARADTGRGPAGGARTLSRSHFGQIAIAAAGRVALGEPGGTIVAAATTVARRRPRRSEAATAPPAAAPPDAPRSERACRPEQCHPSTLSTGISQSQSTSPCSSHTEAAATSTPASSRSRPAGIRSTTRMVSARKPGEQRRADQARLREQTEREAVRVDRLFAASPQLEVRHLEVVRADSLHGVVLELDQRHPPEVVAVAAEAAEVARGAGGLARVLEAVPRGLSAVPGLDDRQRAEAADQGDRQPRSQPIRVTRRRDGQTGVDRAKTQPATATTTDQTSARSIAWRRVRWMWSASPLKTSITGRTTGTRPSPTSASTASERRRPGTKMK